jgi:hypothetical protein
LCHQRHGHNLDHFVWHVAQDEAHWIGGDLHLHLFDRELVLFNSSTLRTELLAADCGIPELADAFRHLLIFDNELEVVVAFSPCRNLNYEIWIWLAFFFATFSIIRITDVPCFSAFFISLSASWFALFFLVLLGLFGLLVLNGRSRFGRFDRPIVVSFVRGLVTRICVSDALTRGQSLSSCEQRLLYRIELGSCWCVVVAILGSCSCRFRRNYSSHGVLLLLTFALDTPAPGFPTGALAGLARLVHGDCDSLLLRPAALYQLSDVRADRCL